MRSIFLAPKRFAAAEQGVAGLEFSIAAPLLILMMLGFVELDRYAWATRELENTANSIAQMMTQAPLPAVGAAGSILPGDIAIATNSVKVLFPRVLQDSARLGHSWDSDIAVGISSVAFTERNPGCVGAACIYDATVAWSGGNARRPCKVPMAPVADTDPPSPTTLPADSFGASSVVVVDLTYVYKPLFLQKIFAGWTLKRSAYLQPRYVDVLKYAVAGGDSLVTTCP